MKCSIKEINKLVECIRSGQPPNLSEGSREEHYYDPALPGLYIRLLNTGVATWTVQWKKLGRQRKIALGDVKIFDRDTAIKSGRELLAKITLGMLDPHEARRERMRTAKVTLATVVLLFLERRKRQGDLRPSTAYHFKNYLTGWYFKPLHNLPIDEITRNQIQIRIDEIAVQSGPIAARKALTPLRLLFKWAIKTDKLPHDHHNPTINIEPPPENAPRERVLRDDEIRLIWKTCEDWDAEIVGVHQAFALTGKRPRGAQIRNPDNSRAIRLAFLTGCRSDEIGNLKWSEVDLEHGEIRIPGSRTKQGVELCNPLSDWAVQILRSVQRQQRSVSQINANCEARSVQQQQRSVSQRSVQQQRRSGSRIGADRDVDPTATFTLHAAAKLTGFSPSVICRALQSGRLSARREKVGGKKAKWQIPASELFRVYPVESDAPPGATLNLYSAAKATGVAPATICRALQSGRISATRERVGGKRAKWLIPPSELFRVFPALPSAESPSKERDAVCASRFVRHGLDPDRVFARYDLTDMPKRINDRIAKAGGTPLAHWTMHDIRRTFRTRMASLGVTMDVAERLVGHIGHRGEMEKTYNRYEYWPEKRRALAMWETNLRAIIDGTAEKIAVPRFGERRQQS